jgi:alpha-ribazole phosphatase
VTTRWWWLRHAPVPGDRITGRLDADCDTADRAAFAALAARLPTDAVLVESGLARCRQTAAALAAAGLVLPAPLIVPDLAEQHFGAWQGRSWSEIDAPGFWADPAGTAPPGGESFAQVVRRVARTVLRLSAEHAGRDVIAIAHAGSIRAAVALALDLTPAAALRLAVDPLSLTRLDHLDGTWRVAGVNR